jgi:surfeit locus 1 family protein
MMELVQRPFSRRWILTTLLVLLGMAVLARLGIWQLDRLKQRRAFNARVLAQVNQPPLDLVGKALQADLANMEYRAVTVTGQYDPSQQVALREQYWGNQWGVDLVTPLHISGTDQTVLVDRGWIPGPDFENGNWSKFDEPGQVVVHGVIRRSQSKADFGSRSDPTPAPGAAPLKAWNFINLDRLSQQMSGPLLPVYVQQAPDPAWTGLPYRHQPQLDLSEGPHMSYAIQWFSFALLLGGGYPFFIRRQDKWAAESNSRTSRDGEAMRKVEERS